MERLASAADAGEVRRCSLDMVKIAGFSSDGKAPAHGTHGRAWITLARPGTPSLPLRIEFQSDWGPISVRMARIDFAQ
jgi:hypothetical protein